MIKNFGHSKRSVLLRTAAAGAIATLALATPAQAIVPGQNETSDSIVDEDGGVNGVGQMVVSNGGGSVGLCTGTLINPRTVIFAAHCVNSRPEDAYGSNTGGVPISFGFAVDNFPAILNWFGSGFSTNTADFLYNVNQVNWNIASAPFGFLEADVAVATLDTPAADIPTWAILFSALPDPGAIDSVTGTGYHVNQTGYGATGNAFAGAVEGIDFRRRLVENYLGALGSLNDLGEPLVGPEPFGADFPQNLYWTDFDSEEDANGDRAAFSDFNWLRDEALPNEGTTAGGDSGGPLVLDAANNAITSENLVLGVLSGGAGFLGGSDQLGSASFYQPLFQFWDYIAANNAYHYVSANAGDGNWEDASHWTSLLDPNYRIIDDSGAIVNGIPTTEPGGINAVEPDFGAVCIQGPVTGAIGRNVCIDLSDGEITQTDPAGDDLPAATITNGAAAAGSITVLGNNSATVQIADGVSPLANNGATVEIGEVAAAGDSIVVVESGAGNAQLTEAVLESQAEGDPLPAPTLANGLPGATDFVPNNVDPDGAGAAGAYYDVTLSNAGTTTLSSAVEIDRLTVTGSAGLDITADGSLNSLIDITQAGGMVNVDGSLSSVGDYFLMTGLLSGSGAVQTPFLTNVMGVIAPGTIGSIGTLTIDGNLILSSGSTLFIDVGASNSSDLVAVTGEANVGGNVAVGNVELFQTATPSVFRILTADDGVTDQFAGVSNLSAILLSNLIYSSNAVDLEIKAQSYQNVINGNDPVQSSYAALLDRNRGNEAVRDLYDVLDFTQDSATIQATLASWAPTTESTVRSMGKSTATNIANFFDSRIALSDRDSSGGTIATMGRPMQTAAMALNGGVGGNAAVMTDFAAASAAQDVETVSNGVNEDIAVYLAGGYLDGEGRSMPLAGQPQGNDEFDGYFIAAGIEHFLSDTSMIGLGFHYTDLDATAALGNTAGGKTMTGTLYGRTMFGQLALDAQLTAGIYEASTQRNLALGPQTFTLNSEDDNLLFTSSVDLSYKLGAGGFSIAPTVGMRATKIDFSKVIETGGPMALTTSRPDYDSLQGRAGLEFEGGGGSNVQFFGSAFYVHEFEDAQTNVAANFTNGVGLLAPFSLAGQDDDWFETSAGVRVNTGNVSFGLSGFTTIKRFDAEARGVSASATIRF